MKQPRTFLLLGVVVATLLLGVAYAAIQNINFNITGTVTATPDQGNFNVRFTDVKAYAGTGTANITKTGDTSARIEISGFSTAGQVGQVKLQMINESNGLTAYIAPKDLNYSGEIYDRNGNSVGSYVVCEGDIDNTMAWTTWNPLEPGKTCNVIIRILWNKTVSEDMTTEAFVIEMEASPYSEGYY